ncbi:hypothetical protein H9L05_11560 [Hymenobacter qilianensis]|nr:hypothetical protein [Hymenobacter qilianensis]QNP50821.1 hypothetical protein H9L05_11560 [Hymenobacter qilianensis]
MVQLANTSVRNEDSDVTSSIQTLLYQVQAGDALQSWSASVELNRLTPDLSIESSSLQATLLRASASYSRYYSPKKRVQARLFGGRFLQKANDAPFVIGLSGSPDYRRQTAFLDRQQISNAFTAQTHQTDDRDGAFKAFVGNEVQISVASQRWLSTLNLQADLPVTGLGIFADFGAMKENFTVYESRGGQNFFYDAGLVVPVIKDIFQFYLPVAGSQYENGLPSSRKDFTDRIRFVLRLDQLNPFRQLDEQLAK